MERNNGKICKPCQIPKQYTCEQGIKAYANRAKDDMDYKKSLSPDELTILENLEKD